MKIIKRNIRNKIKTTDNNTKYILKNRYKDIKNMLKKLKPWVLKRPNKKEELANAFSTIYNFLDKKRQQYANNRTFDEYITNAINAGKGNNENGMYGTTLGQDVSSNFIFDFFDMLTYNMSIFAKDLKSEEEIFDFLKTKLLSADPDVNRLITKW